MHSLWIRKGSAYSPHGLNLYEKSRLFLVCFRESWHDGIWP